MLKWRVNVSHKRLSLLKDSKFDFYFRFISDSVPIPQVSTLVRDGIICHFMTLFIILSGINVLWITKFSVIGLRHYFCDTMENTLLKYPHVPLNKKVTYMTETRWFPTISAFLKKYFHLRKKWSMFKFHF